MRIAAHVPLFLLQAALVVKKGLTLAEVAEKPWQVKSLQYDRFIGHEAWQARSVLRKIAWGNGPTFNGRPAKGHGEITIFASQGEPACVFV